MISSFKTSSSGRSVGKDIHDSILKHVMDNGNFSVSDISEDTGYSVTTIAKYISRLLAENRISETERISTHKKGRKTVRYGMTPDSYYFIGVDMRTFELTIGLADCLGKIIRMESDRDFRLENSHDTLDNICEHISGFISRLEGIDSSRIAAININIPGRVNSNLGTSATTFNFEETALTPLTNILSERLGIRVFIENDTKAMTYGEYLSGPNRTYNNMLYINIGWGLGLGIIIDGKLYYGKDGYSGEFGHVHMYENNILCHCGKKGCIETEVSARAIQRKLTERICNGETSILSQKIKMGETVTTDDIIKATEKEDALCIELVSQAGSDLGHHIAGLINIFNPEIIIIGGNLAKIEDCYFLQPLEMSIRKYSLRLMSRDVPIVTSSLGNNAAVAGACLIARSKVFGQL